MPTTVFLTLTGLNYWTVPDACYIAQVDCIGAGLDGYTTGYGGIGYCGGGGAWSRYEYLSLTPGTSIPYSVGLDFGSDGSGDTSYGNTWFNDTTFTGASVGAQGGQ